MYMSRIADNKDATSSTDVSMLFKIRKYACITRIGILISRILYYTKFLFYWFLYAVDTMPCSVEWSVAVLYRIRWRLSLLAPSIWILNSRLDFSLHCTRLWPIWAHIEPFNAIAHDHHLFVSISKCWFHNQDCDRVILNLFPSESTYIFALL